MPAKPAPRPPKKKPPVVVSSGKSRPVPVAEHGRDRSRSPLGRSPSASRSALNGKHPLPSGVGYEPKPLGVLVAPKALKSNVCLTNHNGGANYFIKR